MKTFAVKFYEQGGHSAGREMLPVPGVIVNVPPDRHDEICNDSPNVLRSPFGRPSPQTEAHVA